MRKHLLLRIKENNYRTGCFTGVGAKVFKIPIVDDGTSTDPTTGEAENIMGR